MADSRQSWRALQAHLAAVRELVRDGRRAEALEAVDSALAIDPNCLAAHALRERIASRVDLPFRPAASSECPEPPQPPAAPPPLISVEGYAKFEQRAKQRRLDRRVGAARAAIARGDAGEAAAALDEVIELHPELPELGELTAGLAHLRRAGSQSRSVRWPAAAVAFGAVLLAEPHVQNGGSLASRSVVSTTSLVAPPAPLEVVEGTTQETLRREAPGTLDTTPRGAPIVGPAAAESGAARREIPGSEGRMAVTDWRPVDRSFTPPASGPSGPLPEVTGPVTPLGTPVPVTLLGTPVPVMLLGTPVPVTPLGAPVPITQPPIAPPQVRSTALPAAASVVDDEVLVKAVLQRYLTAYGRLDARAARAVYPAVNEAALVRAFDGLESQSLTFDSCDLQLRGEVASAICRGSARYVPKVGSREPRVESRLWSFTLRKNGIEWTIDRARAER